MQRVVETSPSDGPLRRVLDPSRFDGFRLAVDRVDLAAGETQAWGAVRSDERMLYVIEGSGALTSADSEAQLDVESVVWLEPPDECVIRGGPEGLALLAVRASAP